MIRFPQAKINLGLRILEKRSDGYHEIDSCMYPIGIEDIIEVIPNYSEQLHVSGLLVNGEVTTNLCWKAYQLIKERYKIPSTYLHLNKQIPMGAGLGGGSSDASAVLLMLNECYQLGISLKQLEEMAAELGSDCPFFIESKPKMVSGRGEIMDPVTIDLSGYYLKVINPGIHIGTAEAYAGVSPYRGGKTVREVVEGPNENWKKELVNDFEHSVFQRNPLLAAIKNELYAEGAVYAAMSGSGSTLFGVFNQQPTSSYSNYFERILQL